MILVEIGMQEGQKEIILIFITFYTKYVNNDSCLLIKEVDGVIGFWFGKNEFLIWFVDLVEFFAHFVDFIY